MAYIRHTKMNKTNLSKSFSGIVSSVNGESIQCVKAAVFVMHKNQQFEGSNDSKKYVYFLHCIVFILITKSLNSVFFIYVENYCLNHEPRFLHKYNVFFTEYS